MGLRRDLDAILRAALRSSNVYFQPPPTVQMQYPSIVYERYSTATKFADNSPYSHKKGYTVTIITKDPDSAIPDRIAMLPTSIFNRFFTVNNLHHFVYTLYY